jgi:four helix bundle protein
MDENELKRRTKQFALQVMALVGSLPITTVGRAIGGQLVRSGMSVGASYRAACRGRSKANFLPNWGR